MTLLGTGLTGRTGSHRFVDLPDDRLEGRFDGVDGYLDRPDALHYAPLDHSGIRRRVAAVIAWIAAAEPALMVVDVSCEIAMLARLASVPTVYVRLSGQRDDEPHQQAFRAASSLLVPFAEALDDPAIPAWIRDRTMYCPGLVPRAPIQIVDPQSVVVVIGKGGSAQSLARWVQAARETPDRHWRVVGCGAPVVDMPDNLTIHGWVKDAEVRIARAGVVIGGAGDGVVGAVLAAHRPFICMPEDRPFAEQHAKADRLVAMGAAVMGGDKTKIDWSALIAAAEQLDPAAAQALDDPNGPARAARYLVALADRGGRA